MTDEFENAPRSVSGALLAVVAVALVCALGGLIWSYTLSTKLTAQQAELADAKQQDVKQAAELRETNARLNVATEELGKSLGLTQKQMDDRADQIIRRQQAAEANAQQLASAQKQTAQQVSAVSSAVTDVKTDVGGVKTDVAKTQNDLAGAIAQLTTMKGDLSDHGSLIARTHEELEVLKHKGDRNIYEFTLQKGQKKPVGTVSLELKKSDQKKSRRHGDRFLVEINRDKNQRGQREQEAIKPRPANCRAAVTNTAKGRNPFRGHIFRYGDRARRGSARGTRRPERCCRRNGAALCG